MCSPTIEEPEYKCICCNVKNGIIHRLIKMTPLNTISFNNFLVDSIATLSVKNINKSILLIDNVPSHKCLMINNSISNSSHRIIYSPPYLPFLNPIENIFSQWKDIIKTSNCHNEEILIKKISGALDKITMLHAIITIKTCLNFCRCA
ncbi:hypothetical protein DMUE_3462 [Dictyocoela muelleri]|nr:hypothetical protein DMUE_3462 [Dictyocoela muelleri]